MEKVSLPTFLLRFRGFRVLQSLAVSEVLKAYGLLSTRSFFGYPGTFGLKPSSRLYHSFSKQ